jgi:superfamily II DNA/RNA helicase
VGEEARDQGDRGRSGLSGRRWRGRAAGALALKGYESLTPVQDAVLAPGVAGRDLLVSAQTGSGKTVAFGLAIAPEC